MNRLTGEVEGIIDSSSRKFVHPAAPRGSEAGVPRARIDGGFSRPAFRTDLGRGRTVKRRYREFRPG